MFIDHMHQLWRTLASIINKRISGKTTSNDRLRQSRVALIWGMFHKKYVDFAELIWEDFSYHIDNRQIREDVQEYRRAIPDAMVTGDIKQSEIYQMFIKYSTGLIPPKKTRGKGSQGKKATVTQKPASVEDNIIPEPNFALELGKSMSLTEAAEEEATRQVYATYERIVTESDPEPARRRPSGISFRDTSNVSKKISPDLFEKLKGIQTMTAEEQLAADTMRALKANKKSSRSQSHVGGSSEGTVTKPGVPDELLVILTTSHKGTGIKPEVPDEVDWLYFDEDEEKKDDADDDKSIDLEVTDNEETDDEFVHGDEYVQENMDEEMKDAEVDDTGNGDEEITDTTKAYTEKTEEVKDDNNIKLQLIFGNFKDTTDAEINSLLDVQIQQEIPHIQSSSILNVHVSVISKSAVLSPIPEIPTVTSTTTPPPPHYVSAISHVLDDVSFYTLFGVV
ncbi:hypothetical protein Tco_1285733 [Tanacetum coccineum]